MQNVSAKPRLWQALPVITLVALALRLVAIRFLYRNTWNPLWDHWYFGYEIGRISRSIASGHGFGNPLSVATGPTAWMTPVYPYLLAAVFKLFGIYSRASAFVILGLNSIFSALICIPVFFIAQRGFGRGVAIAASWTWALLPYSIYLAGGYVWETCLSALLLALLFLWTLKLKERSIRWRWLGYGGLWGISALTNASTLAVLPFLAAWALAPLRRNRRAWLAAAALVLLGLGVVLLPWQARNYRVFHTTIPLRDNFWLEVWVGNNGYAASWFDLMAHPSTSNTELAQFVRLGEIRYMREKRREALGFIAGHPRFFAVMCFRRFAYMWTGFWNLDPANLGPELHDPSNIFLTVPLTLLMLIGLWQAFRNARPAALPYLFVQIFYPLVFCLTHPAIRYRHVIDPEIVILAVVGARYLILSAKTTRPAT